MQNVLLDIVITRSCPQRKIDYHNAQRTDTFMNIF